MLTLIFDPEHRIGRLLNSCLSTIPYAVGLVFFSAAIGKLHLLTYQTPKVITGFHSVDLFGVVVVTSLELSLSVGLWLHPSCKAILSSALWVLVAFTIFLAINFIWLGSDCGCNAGEQLFSSEEGKFTFSILRNFILMTALLLYANYFRSHGRA